VAGTFAREARACWGGRARLALHRCSFVSVRWHISPANKRDPNAADSEVVLELLQDNMVLEIDGTKFPNRVM
jgi:hypothetical protein